MMHKGPIVALVLGAVVFITMPVAYFLYQGQLALRGEIARMHRTQQNIEAPKAMPLPEVTDAVSGKTTWVDVQRALKDTVVQLFVQRARFNWLEPFKPPVQDESLGSGFFISEDGHFISNFHVVEEASSIHIQVPSLGKEQFAAEVVGVSPERDVALLKLTGDAHARLTKHLGRIPSLTLGNSDPIARGQEILALGYPLGGQTLKSTQGIVSGRERYPGHPYGFIQMTAPLNPGNSGGPSINTAGEVIGINSAGVLSAQNVGFIIPINEVKAALDDLYHVRLLRKPFLGGIFTMTNTETIDYFGNPDGGGWYVAHIFDDSLLKRAGVQEGDMLYEVDGFRVDRFGEVTVPWSEDKVSVLELMNRFKVGDQLNFTLYRKGSRQEISFELEQAKLPPVRQVFPDFEDVDHDIIGGMVVMNLTMNHVAMMLEGAPHLVRYRKPARQYEPAVVITHIFANSPAYNSRVLMPGIIIQEVNGKKVETLGDFREACKAGKGGKYLTMKLLDRQIDGMFIALDLEEILEKEQYLASRYYYQVSPLVRELKT